MRWITPDEPMPRALGLGLTLTDTAFLIYWAVAGLTTAGLVALPPEWMYANYDQPDVIAWNWSFFPMDLIFSVVGLAAVRASQHGDARWHGLAIVSLTLTIAAGLMAVSYWTLMGEFDAFWFGTNAALVVWPLFFLRRMLRVGTPGEEA